MFHSVFVSQESDRSFNRKSAFQIDQPFLPLLPGSVHSNKWGVLVTMVFAKINSTYSEVVRKGKLHYYKDLFDQSYLFLLTPDMGS